MEECSDGEDDGAATSWLTTMGLPSHHLPAIQPQKLTKYPSLQYIPSERGREGGGREREGEGGSVCVIIILDCTLLTIAK